MLTFKTAKETGTVAQIEIDVVRLNQLRFDIIQNECKSEIGEALGAFLVQYDFTTVIQLHRGIQVNQEAFVTHLESLI